MLLLTVAAAAAADSRDGTPGVCMIAADLYEGIRPAEGRDSGALLSLLGLLGAEGFALPFPLEYLPLRLQDITVIEREGKARREGRRWWCRAQGGGGGGGGPPWSVCGVCGM